MASQRQNVCVLLATAVQLACNNAGSDGTVDAAQSPQAVAMPAPVQSFVPLRSVSDAAVVLDGSTPPTPLRSDRAQAADSSSKEAMAYVFDFTLRPVEAKDKPSEYDALKRRTETRGQVTLLPSRMKIEMLSGFVMPNHSELWARLDKTGFFLFSPKQKEYRTLAPGTLHRLLDEGRFDVTAPLKAIVVDKSTATGTRLGRRTRSVEVVTERGRVEMEIAKLADLGEGGRLLARFFLEWIDAESTLPIVQNDEVPVHAEARWEGRGGIVFDASKISKRTDGIQASLPPSGSLYAPHAVLAASSSLYLTESELGSFRPSTEPANPSDPKGDTKGDVKDGLLVTNATDRLQQVFIEGVAVAQVAAFSDFLVPKLQRGKFHASSRTFLDEGGVRSSVVIVPGRFRISTDEQGLQGR